MATSKAPSEVTIRIRRSDNGVHMGVYHGGFRTGEEATRDLAFQSENDARHALENALTEMDVEWDQPA